MPHSRYDCTTHPFEQTESEAVLPVGRNTDACSQCYCYMCDVPASEHRTRECPQRQKRWRPRRGTSQRNTRTGVLSVSWDRRHCPPQTGARDHRPEAETQCLFWTTPALCHCNAHHKSRHWKEQCSLALAGTLVTFNLEPLEVNADLRRGGERLLQFMRELAGAYARYLRRERLQDSQACTCRLQPHSRRCPLHQRPQKEPVHRYSEVFELVSSCVSQAEREHPQASTVMLLGTVKEIAVHKDPSSAWRDAGSPGALKLAVPVLMARFT
ncbi:uncharacterized protein LOC131422836 [Diceros bicornis minor]|uniref:uncharacterized protein LOC131422836 n=1 Tax=Diceros bicornis minor TaxID=77932 RepID=UPI0026ECC04A|nr:uncharacterized protein LOC131422836 [Diceros bicornis minor]